MARRRWAICPVHWSCPVTSAGHCAAQTLDFEAHSGALGLDGVSQLFRIMHTGSGPHSAARAGRLCQRPRRPWIDSDQFRDERILGGLSIETAADLLGVTERTIRNWEAGVTRPPYAAFKLMRIARRGDILAPGWQGYRFRGPWLTTPEGRDFGPAELAWLSLLVRRAKLMQDACSKLREERASGAGAGERPSAAPASSPSSCASFDGAGCFLDSREHRQLYGRSAPISLIYWASPNNSPRLTGESVKLNGRIRVSEAEQAPTAFRSMPVAAAMRSGGRCHEHGDIP